MFIDTSRCLHLGSRLQSGARERLVGSAATLESYLGAHAPLERWAESLERELGPGVWRVDGPSAPSALLGLTLLEYDSYTLGRSIA